ncbi:50S ribosome-binding GTPase [Candidatus Woesearchaeota archaeon]|nr:50S ribosome-binding GTPase [Candidatus Woesearchaeota archaeon]
MKNQNIAFRLKKQKLNHVSTEQERIRLLEELVVLNPKDSRDLELRTKFKKELDVLKKKTSSKKKQPPQNIYSSIKYNRQVAIVGEANSGKSTLMQMLTNSNPKISDAPFTTYKPEAGIFVYNDVPIQIAEVPSLYGGDNDKNKIQFIRNSDVICVAVRDKKELSSVISTLEDYLIIISGNVSESKKHKYRSKEDIIEKPSFVAAWSKFDYEEYNVVDISSPTDIGDEIYRLLNIRRVYCFKNGQVDGDPLIFPRNQEVTVGDFAKKIGLGKDKIKGAKIFGSSTTHDGEMVGRDYVLNDGDKVNLK